MLLGHARGKVGDIVFSRANGQQIARARAAVVKNPRTEKQMIQRIILNTVAQAYSKMSAITDHSFEGVQQGQKSMSMFLRKNMDLLRQRIAQEIASGGDLYNVFAFSPLQSNAYASNSFIVSKGSLPEVATSFKSSTLAVIDLSANTYAAVLDQYGLERGDQLTFIVTDGATADSQSFHYARVILDPVAADGSELSLDTALVSNGEIANPNPRNEGEFNDVAFGDGALTFNFSQRPMSGAAVIVSRQKSNGEWLRSNATLEVNDIAIAGFQLSMGECLDLFEAGGIDSLSDLYLNNAGKGKVASHVDSVSVDIDGGGSANIIGFGRGSYGGVSVVTALASDGKAYAIISNDRESMTYNKCLTQTSGVLRDVWKELPSDASHDADTVNGVINTGSMYAAPVSDFWNWAVSHGINWAVIIDAV